jgi:hypothetical protein
LLENCKSAGLREPEFLEIGGSFRVNMFRNTELATNNSGEVREKDGINDSVRNKFGISNVILRGINGYFNIIELMKI